jgi:hypothetical protein
LRWRYRHVDGRKNEEKSQRAKDLRKRVERRKSGEEKKKKWKLKYMCKEWTNKNVHDGGRTMAAESQLCK